MRLAEALGAVSAVLLTIAIFYALAGNPPLYTFWPQDTERFIQPDFLKLSIRLANYIWENLFPAFIAFGIAILALAIGLSTLLTRE